MTLGICRAWGSMAMLWCAVLVAHGAPWLQAPDGRAMLAVASDGRTWLASGDGVVRFDADADAGGALRPTAVFRWLTPGAHGAWTVAGLALDRTGAPGVAVEHLTDTRNPVAARRVATVWLDPAVPAGRTVRVVPVRLPGKVMLAGDASVATTDEGTLLVALRGEDEDDRLVRVDRHGRPDAAFGRRVRLSLPPDLLVTGVVPSTQGPGSYVLGEARSPEGTDGVVLRLRADGSRDEIFGRDGVVRFLHQPQHNGLPLTWVPEALLEDRAGALWTAGRALNDDRNGRSGWWLERFAPNGQRDLEWARQAATGGGAEAWRAAGSHQVAVRVGLIQGGASGGVRVCTWPDITHGALRCAALQSGTALAAPHVVLDRVQVLAVAGGPGEMLTVALADDAGRLLVRRLAFP